MWRWPWQPRTDRLIASDRTVDKIERVADRLELTADQLTRELSKLHAVQQQGGTDVRGGERNAVG